MVGGGTIETNACIIRLFAYENDLQKSSLIFQSLF